MEAVKEYFACIVSASVAAGLLSMLAPEGSGLGKYVRTAISLALVLVICVPLRPAIEYLYTLSPSDTELAIDEELEKYTERTNELIKEKGSELICAAIKDKLLGEFDIPPHECEVLLETEEENGEISISGVTVILSGYSMWEDPAAVRETVEELCGCECEVILG